MEEEAKLRNTMVYVRGRWPWQPSDVARPQACEHGVAALSLLISDTPYPVIHRSNVENQDRVGGLLAHLLEQLHLWPVAVPWIEGGVEWPVEQIPWNLLGIKLCVHLMAATALEQRLLLHMHATKAWSAQPSFATHQMRRVHSSTTQEIVDGAGRQEALAATSLALGRL